MSENTFENVKAFLDAPTHVYTYHLMGWDDERGYVNITTPNGEQVEAKDRADVVEQAIMYADELGWPAKDVEVTDITLEY